MCVMNTKLVTRDAKAHVHEAGGVTEGLSRLPALRTGHASSRLFDKAMSHSDADIYTEG